MNNREVIEMLISLHKKVDVNALSDDGWRRYQEERRKMETALKAEPAPAGTSEEKWPACTCGAGSVGLGAHGVSCAFAQAKEAEWARSHKEGQ